MPEKTLKFGKGKTFTYPDHTEQLDKAEECIDDIKKRLTQIAFQRSITDGIHTAMYDEVAVALYYVGQLSQSIFDLQEDFEEEFKTNFLKSPELGKQLFWQQYEKLHKPYSLLKNRCYRLFSDLDTEYWKCYRKRPPNWKL